MPGKADIVAGIRLDGEKEFKQGVTNINKSITSMKSELALVTAQYDGQQNSLEALTKKQEVLNKLLEEQKKKAAATRAGLNHARESYENVGKGLDKLYVELEKATDQMEELEKIYGSSSDEVREQKKVVDELSAAVSKGEANYERAGNRVKDWEAKLNNAEAQVIKASSEVNRNAAYMKEAEEATDQCATSIDGFGKEVKKAGDIAFSSGEKIKNALVTKGTSMAVDALMKGVESLKESIVEVSEASAHLQANTGASAAEMEKYQDVMSDIRSNNFGQDYNDIAEAMGTVIQTMDGLDGKELQNVTENAITLRDAFGMDYQESIRAVDMLMSQFGITSEEAFNLIVQGTQQGLNKNGDLLDTINEYAVHYRQMGVTADGFFNSLKNGTKAGTFSVDKLGDAYKEFGIRVKDTATSTDEAYELLGLNADEMRAKFAAGGESAKAATDTVLKALTSMDDQVKANQAGVDLFGTMWEDLGADGVLALTNVQGSITTTKDAMTELKDVEYGDISSKMASLGTAIEENILTPIRDTAIPAISGALDTLTELIDPPKSEFEEFMDGISEANDELEASIDNARSTMDNAEFDAKKIEVLGEQLISLNDEENDSIARKYQLKAVVEELGEVIPEIAAAYDEEAGKVDLADESIRNLISSKKELLIAEAAENAARDVAKAVVDAEMQVKQAEEQKALIQDRIDLLQEEKEMLDVIHDQLDGGAIDEAQYQTKYLEFWDEALKNGRVSLEEFEDAVELSSSELYDVLTENIGSSIDVLNINMQDASDEVERYEENAAKCKEELGEFTNFTETLTEALSEEREETEKGVTATKKAVKAKSDMPGSIDAVAAAFEREAGAAKKSAEEVEKAEAEKMEAAQAGADAQKSALEAVTQKYEEFRSQLEQDIQNKISLFDTWDGGTDMTVEDMLANLESQREGLEKWRDNMAILAQEVGTTITPEFYNAILEMGPEAANAVEHMVLTLDQSNGRELLAKIGEEYGLCMDLSGGISEAGANAKIVLDYTLGNLGSSKADFSKLKESIKGADFSDDLGVAMGGLGSEMEKNLLDLAEQAETIGVTIPDGLAAGIADGSITPETAMEQLNGAIQGHIEGISALAEANGIQIPADIAAGIAAGGQDAVDAFNALIELINEKGTEAAEKASEAGETITNTTANAVNETSGTVDESAKGMAAGGAEAAKEAAPNYKASGGELGGALAEGIRGAGETVRGAASQIAAQGPGAIRSWYSAYHSAGYYMSSGVAAGVTAGQSLTIAAANSMAAATLAAAKAALRIHSPSQVFRDQVGKMIPAGTAAGVTANQKVAVQAVAAVHKAAAAEAKKQVLKGSIEYYAALEKVKESRFQAGIFPAITSRFGVSTTDSEGEKKNAEDYYGEVLDAAEQFFDNYQTLHNVDLRYEQYYWQKVQQTLKVGTQAWYDAQAKINELKQERTEELFSSAETGLEQYKTYYKVSERAEVDYWRYVARQFKEGTAERIAADQKVIELRENYYKHLEEMNQDYVEKSAEVNEKLKSQVEELNQTYQDAVSSRKESIYSSFGLFDQFESTSQSGQALLYNLKTQVAGLADWELQLEKLGKKGLSEGLMEELRQMGPQASASIHALLQLSSKELKEYDNLWKQKNALAQSQAVKENEGLRMDTTQQIKALTKDAQKELAALKAEYTAAVAEVRAPIDDALRTLALNTNRIGENVTAQLVAGIKTGAAKRETKLELQAVPNTVNSVLKDLPKQGKIFGTNFLQGLTRGMTDTKQIQSSAEQFVYQLKTAVKKAAGIHSPSKVFEQEIGYEIPAGTGIGIEKKAPEAARKAAGMMNDALAAAQNEMNRQQAVLQEQMSTLNYAGINRLNTLLDKYPAAPATISVDNSGLASLLGTLITVVNGLSEKVGNQQLVLDTGAIVGELQPRLSQESAAITVRKNRGRR